MQQIDIDFIKKVFEISQFALDFFKREKDEQ
jgi:hypothetical protein